MYVAARGGEEAIQNAEILYRALNGPLSPDFIRRIETTLPYLVDRVMAEGSLYAPELAALAIAQTGGDLYEAVLLLRAYRSTVPRLAYAEQMTDADLLVVRRISAAFKDIPGGQALGPTLDYSHRILRTEALTTDVIPETPAEAEDPATRGYPSVADWHRLNGLLAPTPVQDEVSSPTELPDVTRDPIAFPAPRAHRLQSLARADTGGLLALGYASMRGFGLIHPTVNEVRLAYADVRLRHPVTGTVFSLGRARISACEVVNNLADHLELGFTATMGWNEVKTITGAMLDMEMDKTDAHPAHTEEFVLYHTEAVESSGFCIHYKLPHYVTFNSGLDALRRVLLKRDSADQPAIDDSAVADTEEALA